MKIDLMYVWFEGSGVLKLIFEYVDVLVFIIWILGMLILNVIWILLMNGVLIDVMKLELWVFSFFCVWIMW